MQLLVVVLRPFYEFEWYGGDDSTIYSSMKKIIQLLMKRSSNFILNRQIFNENEFLQQDQYNIQELSCLVILFKDDLTCLYIRF